MDKYFVSGKLIVEVPYEHVVEAVGPVEAEKIATEMARKELENHGGLISTRRPEQVHINWLGESDGNCKDISLQ